MPVNRLHQELGNLYEYQSKHNSQVVRAYKELCGSLPERFLISGVVINAGKPMRPYMSYEIRLFVRKGKLNVKVQKSTWDVSKQQYSARKTIVDKPILSLSKFEVMNSNMLNTVVSTFVNVLSAFHFKRQAIVRYEISPTSLSL